MLPGLATRLLCEVDPRLLLKAGWICGWRNHRAIARFRRRVARGENFPAFLFLSITNGCNLCCQGCWVTPTKPVQHLELEALNRIVEVGKSNGSYFYGILGGEPLLHPNLLDFLAAHQDCYFQVFTNGTLIDAEMARAWRRLGNVTPLISIEGTETVSDERRGGNDVLSASLAGLEHCRRERLLTGVATSICQSNIEELATESFARQVIDFGAMYLWYYIYRPVGPRPVPELALTQDQVVELRRFTVELRLRVPLIVVDAYWDHEGTALCPAAVGISHHINPFGDIEPCPIIQFAKDRVQDGDLAETIAESSFLAAFRQTACAATRGCIVLDDPEALKQVLVRENARDTTGRGTGMEELVALCPRQSHHVDGVRIPEKHWLYRFAKKRWFFGLGAYG